MYVKSLEKSIELIGAKFLPLNLLELRKSPMFCMETGRNIALDRCTASPERCQPVTLFCNSKRMARDVTYSIKTWNAACSHHFSTTIFIA